MILLLGYQVIQWNQNTIFDTVYFNEELAHDFASWVSGDSMEPKYHI